MLKAHWLSFAVVKYGSIMNKPPELSTFQRFGETTCNHGSVLQFNY
jgi:hypothetical protein